jgi:hypothetical protein
VELAQLMKQHYWRPGLHDNEAGAKFEALLNAFQVNERVSLICGENARARHYIKLV